MKIFVSLIAIISIFGILYADTNPTPAPSDVPAPADSNKPTAIGDNSPTTVNPPVPAGSATENSVDINENSDTANAVEPTEKLYELKRLFVKGQTDRFKSKVVIKGEYLNPPFTSLVPAKKTKDAVFSITANEVYPDGSADIVCLFEKLITKAVQYFDHNGTTDDSGTKLECLISPTNYMSSMPKITEPKKDNKFIDNLFSITPNNVISDKNSAQLLPDRFIGYLLNLVEFPQLMEFSPQLPTRPVKIGDTWPREIGFIPGMKPDPKGGPGEQGIIAVTCILKLESVGKKDGRDIATIVGTYEVAPDLTKPMKDWGLKNVVHKAKISAKLTYVIDLKTGVLISLVANSTGVSELEYDISDPSSISGTYHVVRRFNLKGNGTIDFVETVPAKTK